MPFGQGINRFRFFYGCIHIPGITETVFFYQNAIKSHNISHRLYLIMLYKVKCGSLYKQTKFREYISPFFAPPLRFRPRRKAKILPFKKGGFFPSTGTWDFGTHEKRADLRPLRHRQFNYPPWRTNIPKGIQRRFRSH